MNMNPTMLEETAYHGSVPQQGKWAVGLVALATLASACYLLGTATPGFVQAQSLRLASPATTTRVNPTPLQGRNAGMQDSRAQTIQPQIITTTAAALTSALPSQATEVGPSIGDSLQQPSLWDGVLQAAQAHPILSGVLAAAGAALVATAVLSRPRKEPHGDAYVAMQSYSGADVQMQVARGLTATAASMALLLSPMDVGSSGITASAAENEAEIGKCVLARCQAQLAGCLADVRCVENLVCIKKCAGKPNEAECQIDCGNLYDDASIQRFDTCAVSDQKCIPTKADDGAYPYPPEGSVVDNFDAGQFDGRWYITAGQNPIFDIFNCQEHFFTATGPGKFYGKLNWRVQKEDGRFLTRSAIQSFDQDPEKPGILYNHNNEYLHYEDDWYILSWEPDTYILVYYRGRNDAWIGYGGFTLYTRADSVTPELEAKYRPTWEAAVKKVGYDWKDFVYTDNSCKPQPQGVVDLDVILDKGDAVVAEAERDLEGLEEVIEEVENYADVNAYMLSEEARMDAMYLEKAIKDEFAAIARQEKKIVSELQKDLDVVTRRNVAKKVDNRAAILEKKTAIKRLEAMEAELSSTGAQ